MARLWPRSIKRDAAGSAPLVRRYDTVHAEDGLPSGEGAFLACSWRLADAYILLGRLEDARRLFQRLLELRNDVDLLAEEYDPRLSRMLGIYRRRSRTWRSSTPHST